MSRLPIEARPLVELGTGRMVEHVEWSQERSCGQDTAESK
jgi:hypothetical protein